MPNGDRTPWWRDWGDLPRQWGAFQDYWRDVLWPQPEYTGRGAWGAGMPGRGTPFAYPEPTRGQALPTMPSPAGTLGGTPYGAMNYTPSQGFGMIPYQGVEGPYAPTGAPAAGAKLTPLENAIATAQAARATIGEIFEGREQPQRQYMPGERGYWAAIGQEPGNYPVPQGAMQGMPGWRRQMEEWSWSTRGIPLQGNEIFRISRGRAPWGRPGGGGWTPNLGRGARSQWQERYGYDPNLSWAENVAQFGAPEEEKEGWSPGAWGQTF